MQNMQKFMELVDKTKLDILNQFIKNGRLMEYQPVYNVLQKTSKTLETLKDYSIEDIIDNLSKEYVEQVRQFVNEEKCPGISAGIQNYNGPEINVYYGKTSGLADAKPIDEQVRFDGASITKMYTALQYIMADYNQKYSLDDKISAINPEFEQDTTLRELLTFYHVFHTDGKLEEVCSNKKQAIALLKKAKIVESNTFLYSDIPYMMASLVDPKFKQNFKNLFIKKMGLTQTGYDVKPEDIITGGAMNALNLVHDPKARILPYAGHAGIYSNTHDSLKLFQKLMESLLPLYISREIATPNFKDVVRDKNGKICYKELQKQIGEEEITRYDPIWVNKAMGVHCQHGLGLEKTDVLPYQSEYAFAADGFTGVWLNYDLANEMSANIFTNPLSGSEEGKKPQGYVWMLDGLKEKSIETLIALKYAQTVFEAYNESDKSEDFHKRYIK